MRFARCTASITTAMLAALVACALLGVLPASTSADGASCTDTWTGAAGDGQWQTARNWSSGTAPGPTDVACIGEGATVEITSGNDQVSSLEDAGTLLISGGALDLVDGAETSSANAVVIDGGTLTGAGKMDVAGSLAWSAGVISGSGSTLIEPGATWSIDPGGYGAVSLDERSVINAGSATWHSGTVYGENGATIINSGTLDVNGENLSGNWFSSGMLRGAGAPPKIVNTGLVAKTAGTGVSVIQFAVENDGTVEDTSEGQLNLWGGGAGTSNTGSWRSTATSPWVSGIALSAGSFSLGANTTMSGTISFSGADVQADSIAGADAKLTLWGGGSVLDLTSTTTASHVKELTQLEAGGASELTGAGTLDISDSLTWSSGTMSGAGRTVLEPGGTGSIEPGAGNAVSLSERELANEGTLTWGSGSLEARSSAEFDNLGRFIANAEVPAYEWSQRGLLKRDGSDVWLRNTGTIEKTSGNAYTQIQLPIDNEGVLQVASGQIILSGGSDGGGGGGGSWDSSGTGQVSFNAGDYDLGSGVQSAGTWIMAGANVSAGDIQGSDAQIVLLGASSTLELTDPSTGSHLGTLELDPSTTLAGAGELDLMHSLVWREASTMSGSGSTILAPGASGSIEASSGCEPLRLARALVNEGALSFGWGTLMFSEGAGLENRGTFEDNTESSCLGAQLQQSGSGAAPRIVNTGTFEKSAGGGTTTVAVNFSDRGVVEAKTGTLDFTDGGVPEQAATGAWTANGGSIALGGGTFLIGEEVDLSGVSLAGATVERTSATGAPEGRLNPLPYAADSVEVSGAGSSVGTGFGAAAVEVSPAGGDEWHALCGPLTPDLNGEFSCSWDTGSGSYVDGEYELRAALSDSAEPPDTAPTPAISVLVDNTPPTGALASSPYLSAAAISVSGTAQDSGSGVASWQLQIRPRGALVWANACPVASAPAFGSTYRCNVATEGLADGAYELRALILDNAGNEYATAAVDSTLDTTAPTGSLSRVTDSAYVRGSVELQGTAADAGSGVMSWTPQIREAGADTWSNACAPQTMPTSGSVYECSLNTKELSQGEYTTRAEVLDNAGNTYSSEAQTFTIDNTAPHGSLYSLPRDSSGSVEVAGPAGDDLSGVATWQLQIEATGSNDWQNACLVQTMPTEEGDYGCSIDSTSLPDGGYQFRAVIEDNAGNVNTTRPVSTHIDNVDPAEALEVSCTDDWTGEGGDGLWQTAANWSSGAIPTSGDRACIASGITVHVSGGVNQVGSLGGGGSVVLSGGELGLTDGETVSEVGVLTVNGGTLGGIGTLDVNESLSWSSGQMSGGGQTVLTAGASGSIDSGGGYVSIDGRELLNEGTLTIGGQIDGSGSLLNNNGTLQKNGEPGTGVIAIPLDNEGLVSVTAGKLELTGGGDSGEHRVGSWSASGSGTAIVFNSGGRGVTLGSRVPLAGSIEIAEGLVTSGKIEGADADITIAADGPWRKGTLEVNGPSRSTVRDLTMTSGGPQGGGLLTGSGELDVTDSFSSDGYSSLTGSGSTVIAPGASGVIVAGSTLSLGGRTLSNDGTLTLSGTTGLQGSDRARLANSGTLVINSEGDDEGHSLLAGTGEATLVNSGTIEKTTGDGTTLVAFAIDNEGTVQADSGRIEFTDGGSSGQLTPDTWSAAAGASIQLSGFSSQSYNLGDDVTVSGQLAFHADVNAGTISGPSGELVSQLGNLQITGLVPSTLKSLTLAQPSPDYTNEQRVEIASELDVLDHVGWGSDDAFFTSGVLVAKPGSTTTFDPGAWVQIRGGQYINEGDATWTTGGFQADEAGTFFINRGTFNADQNGENPFVQGCKWNYSYSRYQCPVFRNEGKITGKFPTTGSWAHKVNWRVDIVNVGDIEAPYWEEPICKWEYTAWPGPGGEACYRAIAEYEGLLVGNEAEVISLPLNIGLPSISGEPEEEQKLVASPGVWQLNDPSYSYQWQHCGSEETEIENEADGALKEELEGGLKVGECRNIAGATSSTYQLSYEDVGYAMRVVVTASNAYRSQSNASAETEAVYQNEAFDEEEAGAEEEEESAGSEGERFSRGKLFSDINPDDDFPEEPCSETHRVCGKWNFGSKQLADEYAETYAEAPNAAEYHTYSDDCTDYISQILHAAGMPMLAAFRHVPLDWWTREQVWFSEGGKLVSYAGDHTNSWTVARALYEELLHTGIARPLKRSETPEAGDLVFFHWFTSSEPINHVGMIVSGDNHNQTTEIYTSHTENRLWTMAREFKQIGIYLHEKDSSISPSEDARGLHWQWYVLRPIHTDAYVP